jgi:phosphate transport system substrate-binding protein
MNSISRRRVVCVLASVAVLVACSKQPPQPTGGTTSQIQGAGATFPYPVYSKWFSEYAKSHPDVQINYQSIGSGGGIRQLTNKTVFFGASDGPMTDEQLKAAPGPILHLPTVLGAVVPVYNLPGVGTELKFTGPLLADIYLGRVKKWNDAQVAGANPGVALPASDIVVVHRADGSGTTYIFCDYLAKVSPDWKSTVGVNTSVSWPVGVGGKGNEGVAGQVQQTPGAIGYVELVYAVQNHIAYGSVRNAAGQDVKASTTAVTAAAAGAVMPADFRVSITNATGKDAYPISSFTWMLLFQSPDDKAKAQKMVEFMKWALTDGQPMAEGLGYARLPEAVVKQEMDALGTIQAR